MNLKVKSLKLVAGRPVAFLHKNTAKLLSVFVGERIRIRRKHSIVAITDIVEGMLKEDEIALSDEVIKAMRLMEGQAVDVTAEPQPKTTHYILEKLQGKELNYNKLFALIGDIVHNALTEAELAYFISGVYVHGMTDAEIADMIRAMVEFGKKLNLKDTYDKHCIGGIAGNRTTPIVVSICAAAGIKMAKTSSRAITSAAGTADVVEVLANVEFNAKQIKKIVNKTNACLVWGGSLGLAPADDKLIQVERLLSLDPKSQLIASILAKKLAIGSRGVLIDIPFGNSAKAKTRKEAKSLGKKFKRISKMLGLKLEIALTDGSQPIGNGIGPVLEARDLLKVLKQDKDRPKDLEIKSLYLASSILKMAGMSESAEEILKSGKAYKKFNEIIEAQGGSLKNIEKTLPKAKFSVDILAEKSGKIIEINNKKISSVAKMAGCPADKSSGLFLYKHVRDSINQGEKLATIYSGTKEEAEQSKRLFCEIRPYIY